MDINDAKKIIDEVIEKKKIFYIKQNANKKLKELGVNNENKVDWEFLQKQKEGRTFKPYHFTDKYYSNVSSKVFNMARIKDSFKNPTTLLLYMYQWKGWTDHEGKYKNGVCGEWYKNGFVVCSQAREQMAVDLGVSEKTISKWVKRLEHDQLIVIEKNGIQNIYVLGLVDENSVESYFFTGDIPVYRKPKEPKRTK